MITPNDGESQELFMDRCMADESMMGDYPDEGERQTQCQLAFDKGPESPDANDDLDDSESADPMPMMPTPNDGETSADFMDRCVMDEAMVSEYPDETDRRAQCQIQWDTINSVAADVAGDDSGME